MQFTVHLCTPPPASDVMGLGEVPCIPMLSSLYCNFILFSTFNLHKVKSSAPVLVLHVETSSRMSKITFALPACAIESHSNEAILGSKCILSIVWRGEESVFSRSHLGPYQLYT